MVVYFRQRRQDSGRCGGDGTVNSRADAALRDAKNVLFPGSPAGRPQAQAWAGGLGGGALLRDMGHIAELDCRRREDLMIEVDWASATDVELESHGKSRIAQLIECKAKKKFPCCAALNSVVCVLSHVSFSASSASQWDVRIQLITPTPLP
jgi:hypothetical protein